MKRISIVKFVPGIAWFFVVLVLICTPGKELPKINWLENINFDKLVHVMVFGLLAVLFCWPFYKSPLASSKKLRYFITIAILTSIWGYCTELIQKYWIEGRTYDLFDWAADSLGAFLALLFCRKKFI